jgi:hypothetical protein
VSWKWYWGFAMIFGMGFEYISAVTNAVIEGARAFGKTHLPI